MSTNTPHDETNNTSTSTIENTLKAFGFVSNEARRNLVIFFIVILLFSNGFFIYQNIGLTNKIQDLNVDHNKQLMDLSNKITEEVRKQIKPTQKRIYETTNRIDSVTTTLQTQYENQLKK